MRKIVVTGAAGFIGSFMTKRLVADGNVVLGVDNFTPYYDVTLKKDRINSISSERNFMFEEFDLSDYEATARIVSRFKPEIIIHLAAQAGVRYSIDNPKAYTASNVDGFVSILEASRASNVRHLLYASSSSVYGANQKVPFSESDAVNHPVSLYAATKRANELMAFTYSHLFGLPTTGLRFFTVYGPWGRPDMAYFKFAKAIFSGSPIDVYNNGKMARDFTYISDVVEAIARLAAAPFDNNTPGNTGVSQVPSRVFNVGNHTPVELEIFISILETLIGRRAERRMLPMQLGDVERTFADVTLLQNEVGFSPDTSLEDGLGEFVAWYRKYYNV